MAGRAGGMRQGLVLAVILGVTPALCCRPGQRGTTGAGTLRAVPAIESDQRRQVADAPPFEVIARKFGLNPEMLAFSLLDPHPRMNLMLTRREAQDIAAYISTLAK